jgi:hypothetical protein
MWVNTYLCPYSFNLSEIVLLLLMRLQLGHNLTHVSFAAYIDESNNMNNVTAMSEIKKFYIKNKNLITFPTYAFNR